LLIGDAAGRRTHSEYDGDHHVGADNVHGVRFLRVLFLEDLENPSEVGGRNLTVARSGSLEVGKFLGFLYI
jgi:hypothetical protein